MLIGLIMALLSGGIASTEPAESPQEAVTATADISRAVEDLLSQLEEQDEGTRSGYSRSQFPHWSDLDRNGCSARDDTLINETESGTVEGCKVVGGRWFSIYDAEEETSSTLLDVDHMVPLAEAWDSDASSWSKERRQRYANDLGYEDALIAVTRGSNRSKSDQDPAQWQPTNTDSFCRYATAWTTVKIRWGLTADAAEVDSLREMLDDCAEPPPTNIELAPQ